MGQKNKYAINYIYFIYFIHSAYPSLFYRSHARFRCAHPARAPRPPTALQMSSSAHPARARAAPIGGTAETECDMTSGTNVPLPDVLSQIVDNFDDIDDPEAARAGTTRRETGPSVFPSRNAAPQLARAASYVENDMDDARTAGIQPLGASTHVDIDLTDIPSSPALPAAPAAVLVIEDDGAEAGNTDETGDMRVLDANDESSEPSKKWVFTHHDPSEDDMALIRIGDYGMWQLERAPTTGKLHLQGFATFKKAMRWKALHNKYPRTWFAPMRGNIEQCIKYCTKGLTAVVPRVNATWGVKPSGQGARTDLLIAADLVREGGAAAVASERPDLFIKFSRGVTDLEAKLGPRLLKLPAPVWRPWQQELVDKLRGPVNDRHIYWYADGTGGQGKSTLVRHIINDPSIAGKALCLEGKVADMAYAFTEEYKIVFFDVSRTMALNISHLASFAENLKNGRVFSTKYQSVQKTFEPVHVVFFANFEPPTGRQQLWSADRLQLTVLSPASVLGADMSGDDDAGPPLPPPSLLTRAPRKRSATDALMDAASQAAMHPCAECSKMINTKWKKCYNCM